MSKGQHKFHCILVRHGWDMRKTSILNKLNCKSQTHVKVCEENKENEKDQWLFVKFF